MRVRIISVAVATFLLIYGVDLVPKSTFTSPALQWPYTYLYLAVPSGAALSLMLLALTPVAGLRGAGAGALLAASPASSSISCWRVRPARASSAISASSGRW